MAHVSCSWGPPAAPGRSPEEAAPPPSAPEGGAGYQLWEASRVMHQRGRGKDKTVLRGLANSRSHPGGHLLRCQRWPQGTRLLCLAPPRSPTAQRGFSGFNLQDREQVAAVMETAKAAAADESGIWLASAACIHQRLMLYVRLLCACCVPSRRT